MRDALRDRLDLLQNLAGPGFEVTLETRSECLPADIDEPLLTQALSSLVKNSAEAYGPDGGRIRIGIEQEEIAQEVAYLHPGTRPGHFVRVRVSDEGHGMHAEVLAHAVDPLFSTKKDLGHAGLGLSTVFAVVREHDGFMTLESRPKKGTTVSLYFPLSEQSVPAVTGHNAAHSNSTASQAIDVDRTRSVRVLLLQGRDELRELVGEMVHTLGYTVAPCKDQVEALETLKQNEIDIVLIDEAIPQMNTTRVIEELRAARSSIKAVVLTASSNPTTGQSTGVVTKPFDMNQLADALRLASADIPKSESDASIL